MSTVRSRSKVESIEDNSWASSWANVTDGYIDDRGEYSIQNGDVQREVDEDRSSPVQGTEATAAFVGCDDVEPEQIVIKVEPEQLDDADSYNPESEGLEEKFLVGPSSSKYFGEEGISSSSYAVNNADNDFALQIKRTFGSLSSRLVETEAFPTVSTTTSSSRRQREKCLNQLQTLFPTLDAMELLNVLVRHDWAVGISVRHLRASFSYRSGRLKAKWPATTSGGVAPAAEPVSYVTSSFSVDHKEKTASKSEIVGKEKCLQELGNLFPTIDCLELHDVLACHRWSLEPSVDYLKRNLGTKFHVRPKLEKCDELFKSSDVNSGHESRLQEVSEAHTREEVDDDFAGTDDNANRDLTEKINRAFNIVSSRSNSRKKPQSESFVGHVLDDDENFLVDEAAPMMDIDRDKPKSSDFVVTEVTRDTDSNECDDDDSLKRRRKAAVDAVKKFACLDWEEDGEDVKRIASRKLLKSRRRYRARPPACDRSKLRRPRILT